MSAQLIDLARENWAAVEQLFLRLEALRRDDYEHAAAYSKIDFESLDTLKKAFDLDDADATILTLALAPTANPKLGWLYREFQSGDSTGLPGIDLIIEMLQLSPEKAIAYRNRLADGAPLMKQGLLVTEHWRPYSPLRPTSRALRRVFGVRHSGNEIPGAVLMAANPLYPAVNGSQPTRLLSKLVCPPFLRRQIERVGRWPNYDPMLAKWGVLVEHGPVVLFAGPSGTGKTMAARAVAEQADLPLFRVDMGMLVSKYIGETPKNINALFEHAKREEAVLLFDEAEGLFGKRGQVKDARDRYANMEVGHLLSRIENYSGICLLTTNLREHIDSAFLRRIDVVLHFNAPTDTERARLWRNYLGSMIASDDCLPDDLADGPALTGAQIASACRYAARCVAEYDAPDNNGRPDRGKLLGGIAEGVWSEFRKRGPSAVRSSLGVLEQHLVEY